MDCQMPEMDGFAATAAIRASEAQRSARGGAADGRPAHIPIIAVTAHAMQGDRDASLAAGMDDHLCKPFSLDALRAVLQRWMPAFALRAPAGEPSRSTEAGLPADSPAVARSAEAGARSAEAGARSAEAAPWSRSSRRRASIWIRAA